MSDNDNDNDNVNDNDNDNDDSVRRAVRLAEDQRRSREMRERRSRERKAAQVLVSAYHVSKGLSSMMSMLMFDLNSLPEGERDTVTAAANAALATFSLLNSITIDAGNIAAPAAPAAKPEEELP